MPIITPNRQMVKQKSELDNFIMKSHIVMTIIVLCLLISWGIIRFTNDKKDLERTHMSMGDNAYIILQVANSIILANSCFYIIYLYCYRETYESYTFRITLNEQLAQSQTSARTQRSESTFVLTDSSDTHSTYNTPDTDENV